MKVREGLWRVARAAPQGVGTSPWDTIRIARCRWPAEAAFVCAKDVGDSTNQVAGINAIAAIRSAGGWFVAGRRPSGNNSDGGGQKFDSSTRPRNNAGGLAGSRKVAKSLRRQPHHRSRRRKARGHAAEKIRRLFVIGRDAMSLAGILAAARLAIAATTAGERCGGYVTESAST